MVSEQQEAIVTIGMPVYNDKDYIKLAIDSLLAQTYTNFKLIISDDCSSDGSENICREYEKNDKRVTYIRQSANIGISKNMMFLLEQAQSKYFMWAGNDDFWDKNFIKSLVQCLEDNPQAVSSFSLYTMVDEAGNIIPESNRIAKDYSGRTGLDRLNILVSNTSDAFGYGLFVRDKILGVQFPTWWWVNKKCAYNNIYPTLCYYLTKGDFVLYDKEVLWFNRIKPDQKINHKIPFSKSFVRGYLAFVLRRFNMVAFSLKQIVRAEHGIVSAALITPRMVYNWFYSPCISEFKGALQLWKSKDKTFF